MVALEQLVIRAQLAFLKTGDQAALVFTRYENEYRLSDIWESNTEGFTLPESSVLRDSVAPM